MKRYGLLGCGISYSLSPTIHRIILKESGIDAEYVLYDKCEKEAQLFLQQMDFDGINVTVPYKTTAIKYCDELSVRAAAVGAANTLTRREKSLAADNTDVFGLEMLYETNAISFKNHRVVILGTGGAAKAVKYSLRDKGAKQICCVSRKKQGSDIISYEELAAFEEIDVLFNATALGAGQYKNRMPIGAEVIEKCRCVIDLNYAPLNSLLLQQAKAMGKTCHNGLDMLIYQAMKSQEIWNNVAVTKDLYEMIRHQLIGSGELK